MGGFTNLKDVLDVIVIPLAVLALGWLLPLTAEWRRQSSFSALIRREIGEAAPSPREPQRGLAWHEHMQKRFLHEEIFRNVSENRDFILSLDPLLIYNLAQLWIHFDKGREATRKGKHWQSLKEARRFRYYLWSTCIQIDGKNSDAVTKAVYCSWDKLITAYEMQAVSESNIGQTS